MTTSSEIVLPPLPDWNDCARKNDRMHAMTALERFIYNNEPADNPTKVDEWRSSVALVIEQAIADYRASVADRGVQAVPGEPVALDELHPKTAYEFGRAMARYCESFNGQDWAHSTIGNVDRRNLATALDNLTECSSMLMNQSDRLAASVASPSVASARQFIYDAHVRPECSGDDESFDGLSWYDFGSSRMHPCVINARGRTVLKDGDWIVKIGTQYHALTPEVYATLAAPASPSVAQAEPAVSPLVSMDYPDYLRRDEWDAAVERKLRELEQRTYRVDAPAGRQAESDQRWKALADVGLNGKGRGFLVNGWHVPASVVTVFEEPQSEAEQSTLPSTPKAEGEGKQS